MLPGIGNPNFRKNSKVDLSTGLLYYWNFESSFDAVNSTIGTGGTSLPTRTAGGTVNSYYVNFPLNTRLTYDIRPTSGDVNKFNTEDISISFWYKKSSATSSYYFSIYHSTTTYRNFRLYISSTITFDVFKASSPTNSWSVSGGSPGLDTWNHVVVTFKNTTEMKVYLNGVLANTTVVDGLRNKAAVTGQTIYMNADYVDGYSTIVTNTDEVGIWGIALTQNQVTALYSSSYKFYPFT